MIKIELFTYHIVNEKLFELKNLYVSNSKFTYHIVNEKQPPVLIVATLEAYLHTT